MSAFAECFLCPARITEREDWQTDAQIAAKFEEQGWQMKPVRCPEHVGMVTAPPLEDCTWDHDPEPFVTRIGLQMAQVIFSSGREKPRFSPRASYCTWYPHYAEILEKKS